MNAVRALETLRAHCGTVRELGHYREARSTENAGT